MIQQVPHSPLPARADPPVGHKRVLVVDDDPGIRDLFAEALGRAGFDVTAAANGAEAIREIESAGFEAVTCDLEMPILGGTACYAKVLAIRPEVAASFVFVGSRPDPVRERLIEDTGRPFLWKPVPLGRLIETVRGVVDRTARHN